MKFSKVIGDIPKEIVRQTEEKISSSIVELSINHANRSHGSKLGGDPVLFQLLYSATHICDGSAIVYDSEVESLLKPIQDSFLAGEITEEELDASEEEIKKKCQQAFGGRILRTAATNGKEFFWSPTFVLGKSAIGLRLVAFHEGWHSLYMHPSRRGSRRPDLWNKSVDFKVNYMAMLDLKHRGINKPSEVFRTELGDFITLAEYAAFLKDPWNPPEKMRSFSPIHELRKLTNPDYKNPDENISLYFADENLTDDFKKPEAIYDYLWHQVPRCSCCGKVNYKKPAEAEELLSKLNEKNQKNL